MLTIKVKHQLLNSFSNLKYRISQKLIQCKGQTNFSKTTFIKFLQLNLTKENFNSLRTSCRPQVILTMLTLSLPQGTILETKLLKVCQSVELVSVDKISRQENHLWRRNIHKSVISAFKNLITMPKEAWG